MEPLRSPLPSSEPIPIKKRKHRRIPLKHDVQGIRERCLAESEEKSQEVQQEYQGELCLGFNTKINKCFIDKNKSTCQHDVLFWISHCAIVTILGKLD